MCLTNYFSVINCSTRKGYAGLYCPPRSLLYELHIYRAHLKCAWGEICATKAVSNKNLKYSLNKNPPKREDSYFQGGIDVTSYNTGHSN